MPSPPPAAKGPSVGSTRAKARPFGLPDIVSRRDDSSETELSHGSETVQPVMGLALNSTALAGNWSRSADRLASGDWHRPPLTPGDISDYPSRSCPSSTPSGRERSGVAARPDGRR
jgi:hypothetical protein